jgi:hypothetical protein
MEKFPSLTFFGVDSKLEIPNNRLNLMFVALLYYKSLLVDFQDGHPNLIQQIILLFWGLLLFPIQNLLQILLRMLVDLRANQ